MDINETKSGDVTVVALKGRLDATSAKPTEERLLKAIEGGAHRLVLDLSEMAYISSVGLRVLMVVAKRLKPLGGKVAVAGLQPSVKQVFDIAGFGTLFPVAPSSAEAIKALE